jgi:hypothetical protein
MHAAGAEATTAVCCMSATGFGRVWQESAFALQLGRARSLGQWDSGGSLRWNASGYSDGLRLAQPWAIVRVHERVQVQAWIPVYLNDRRSAGQMQLAGGVGDIGAASRFELIGLSSALHRQRGARRQAGARAVASGAMRFRGWIDNERRPADCGREPWLDRAIAGVLEGKSFESRSAVYGCRITRSLRDPRPEAGSCCGGAGKTGGGAR